MKNSEVVFLGLLALALVDNHARKYPPKIIYRNGLFGNANGRCLPPFGIFIDESQRGNRELLNHELVHWYQYKKLGLLEFYMGSIIQNIKYGYDNAPLEIEARGVDVQQLESATATYPEVHRGVQMIFAGQVFAGIGILAGALVVYFRVTAKKLIG